MEREVLRFPDADSLARRAAAEVAGAIVRSSGPFVLALPGGRSPVPLFRLLVRPPWRDTVPWGRVHLFVTDERLVPPGHPESNIREIRRGLVEAVQLPEGNLHVPPLDAGDPEAIAAGYGRELRRLVTGMGKEGPDLVVLGMGVDGHTASLFAADAALEEGHHWVAATSGPVGEPKVRRITLTLPALAAAETVILLAGPGKAETADRILRGREARYPAAMVTARNKLIWMICEE
jgi:6-phosphogluconolactonase